MLKIFISLLAIILLSIFAVSEVFRVFIALLIGNFVQ